MDGLDDIYSATLWIISLYFTFRSPAWTLDRTCTFGRPYIVYSTQPAFLQQFCCNILPQGMESKLPTLFPCVLRDFAMYLFLVSFLGVSAWPQYGGQREVTSLDGQWLFGFNASKDFDVLQDVEGMVGFQMPGNVELVCGFKPMIVGFQLPV